MNLNFYLEMGINLLSILAELVILGICIYYFVKTKSVDSVLLLISSIMSALYRPLSMFVFNYVLKNESGMSDNFLFYKNLLGFYGLVSTIIFSIGLFLMVIKLVKYIQNEHEF